MHEVVEHASTIPINTSIDNYLPCVSIWHKIAHFSIYASILTATEEAPHRLCTAKTPTNLRHSDKSADVKDNITALDWCYQAVIAHF